MIKYWPFLLLLLFVARTIYWLSILPDHSAMRTYEEIINEDAEFPSKEADAPDDSKRD